jgi:hypothetical protein
MALLLLLILFGLGTSTNATIATVTVTQPCPCATGELGVRACSGGPYVDYYYYEPYSGSPANSSYLPPEDAVPNILAQLTSMRDSVKAFLGTLNAQDSNITKALYLKDNYEQVHFILKAVNRAANATSATATPASA